MSKTEAGYRVSEIEHYPLSNHCNPTENRDSNFFEKKMSFFLQKNVGGRIPSR